LPFAVKIIWKTKQDSEVCPICRELEGYTWTLKAGVDSYPDKLVHPIYGPVYDTRPVAERSLIKELTEHECRCTIKHEFDLSCVTAEAENTAVNAMNTLNNADNELRRTKLVKG
jgi:hypothetical protein